MFGLSRQQLIAWSAVGLVVLLLGANYLRGHLSTAPSPSPAAVTVGLKDEKPAPIKIHIIGAVTRPGLYEIGAGSRVADALALAGGPTASADLTRINLAAKVADGQQLVVPEAGAPTPSGNAAAGGQSGAGPAQPVNLNSATEEQLTALDGVGPKTAQKIIQYREEHGGFKSIDELLEVTGIGPAKFEQIRGQVVI